MKRWLAALLLGALPLASASAGEHVVARGETLMAISRAYYGTSERAAELARVNGLADANQLRVGQHLTIPDLTTNAAPAKPAAPRARPQSKPAVPAATEAPDRLGQELRHAVNAYLDGDYAGALERLEHLRTPVLARGSVADQKLLLEHLVFVHVAFGRQADACDALRGLERVDPDTDPRRDWDPDLISPKIRDAVRACPRG